MWREVAAAPGIWREQLLERGSAAESLETAGMGFLLRIFTQIRGGVIHQGDVLTGTLQTPGHSCDRISDTKFRVSCARQAFLFPFTEEE